jgi:hypothetical protein
MKNHYELMQNIYRQLYREATPSADFDRLLQDHSGPFFEEHYLAQDRQDEIIREHCKGMRRGERRMIEATIALGCSPRGIKKVKP